MNTVHDSSAKIADALDQVGPRLRPTLELLLGPCQATVRFVLGDEDLVLRTGDVAEFDTLVPHRFGSTGDEPSEILSIFDRPGERMNGPTNPRCRCASESRKDSADITLRNGHKGRVE